MIAILFACDAPECESQEEIVLNSAVLAVPPVDWCDWGGVQLCPTHSQALLYPSRERMNRAVEN